MTDDRLEKIKRHHYAPGSLVGVDKLMEERDWLIQEVERLRDQALAMDTYQSKHLEKIESLTKERDDYRAQAEQISWRDER